MLAIILNFKKPGDFILFAYIKIKHVKVIKCKFSKGRYIFNDWLQFNLTKFVLLFMLLMFIFVFVIVNLTLGNSTCAVWKSTLYDKDDGRSDGFAKRLLLT